MLLHAMNVLDEKFHIQVMNVCDKKYLHVDQKKEYYNYYRWVVCGCLFITGKVIGHKILNRLNEIFEETTNLGYGHGEEMFYLEILEEFPNELTKSYGDYQHILNNFQESTVGYDYVNEFIVKNYLQKGYYKECYECCLHLLEPFENFTTEIHYSFYFKFLFSLFISSYYHKRDECDKILNRIKDLIKINKEFRHEYEKNKSFYDNQFKWCSL